MNLFGIHWVGIDPETGQKAVYSLVLIAVIITASSLLRAVIGLVLGRTEHETIATRFWTRQVVSLLSAALLVLGLMSIWFTGPEHLATAFGLVSAGLAFALQQVITSLAGYLVILRGSIFSVGDRISMGGVRGDVLRLGFIQTTIMEMGQPPTTRADPAGVWVQSRQFTGRVVTVTNSRIFAEPVYNYTRDFPFIWEEIAIPITYAADRAKAESVLIEAARRHAVLENPAVNASRLRMRHRFGVELADVEPRVFYRITDNWLELTVRFLVGTHDIRAVKDAMNRQILAEFDQAGIGIASSTYDIVGFPELSFRRPTGRDRDGPDTA